MSRFRPSLVVRAPVSTYMIEPIRFDLGLSRVGMVDDHLAALVADGRARSADADVLLDARAYFARLEEEKEEGGHMITDHPVNDVRWVPMGMVQANDYNPNAVAPQEMRLLYTSIKADGYTQPIVTVWDEDIGKYIVVDGFHRWTICRAYPDIMESTEGMLPIVVLDKSPADRMAATVRHNRARGKHSVAGMSNLVLRMLQEGMDDAAICTELGLEAEELLRLKHITGFSALMRRNTYTTAWETGTQLDRKREWLADHPEDAEKMV